MSEENKKASEGKGTMTSKKKTTSGTQDPGKNKVTIEVSKYKSILEVLGDPNKTWRVLLGIFFLGVILFTGIAVVASAIKKLYPYSDITTNGLGATTIKSEKKEVSYWLYNTSQLWANSGIAVKEGDIITIRSSGQFYTAIHHLYSSAKDNVVLKDRWVDSGGEADSPANLSQGSYYRRKFRMFPNLPTGTLVMQVANNNPYDTPREEGADPEDFYFIGKERQNIYIKHPGTLYFSLNDIVLNKRTIVELMYDCLCDFNGIKEDFVVEYFRRVNLYPWAKDAFYDEKAKKTDLANKICSKYSNSDLGDYLKSGREGEKRIDNMFHDFALLFKDKILNSEKGSRTMSKYKLGVSELIADNIPATSLDTSYLIKRVSREGETVYLKGKYSVEIDNKTAYIKGRDMSGYDDETVVLENPILESENRIDLWKKSFKLADLRNNRYKTVVAKDSLELYSADGPIFITDKVKVCEMEYYLRNDYKTAWFDDNIGSFLIVIEKDSK